MRALTSEPFAGLGGPGPGVCWHAKIVRGRTSAISLSPRKLTNHLSRPAKHAWRRPAHLVQIIFALFGKYDPWPSDDRQGRALISANHRRRDIGDRRVFHGSNEGSVPVGRASCVNVDVLSINSISYENDTESRVPTLRTNSRTNADPGRHPLRPAQLGHLLT